MLTDVSPRVPSKDELDELSNVICYLVSEVEGIAMTLSLLKSAEGGDFPLASLTSPEQLLGAIEEARAAKEAAPPPEVSAADAWHLHVFAEDCRTTAENLVRWAAEIDANAAWLYHEGGRGSTLTAAEKRALYSGMADWLERKAREHRADAER